ncbi:enoyl-CoA hydratase/isomerase family protein [Acidovorax cavernicola]|uniref:Enoyl-CoA hydratase/isomerase family protein n=1 Tax=Acidovorax cavernicola TaxID=1675792 RepID=A0A9X8D3F4_9BURK|nr:enoyl-CoA hydratase/isomerase family protein [Acidovorax cavernicola]RIX78127.1 enoyl-CoA hydratase/isomerase family protein [Acidovorax cavernicola]
MSHIASIESGHAHVALLEIRRGPFNYVNEALLRELADALDRLDADPDCRAVVLAAEGRAFSAGADFNGGDDAEGDGTSRDPGPLYAQAMRLFRCAKPIVAAVHGAAVGAGLGLAVAADFRVSCAEARFSANFNRLGFHPGFGLSATLPRLVGAQQAGLLFFTGRRIGGEEALRIGLVDLLVPADEVRASALALAVEIALSAPLAVEATRATLRRGLADAVTEANRHERDVQRVQFATDDFKEGVRAMAERRAPQFQRR